jgi:hypothetical protein
MALSEDSSPNEIGWHPLIGAEKTMIINPDLTGLEPLARLAHAQAR